MRVDHLVWYCADLAEGERYFAERMDRGSVYGGVHPGEGTANRLLSLSDATYLEILGRDPAQPRPALLRKSGVSQDQGFIIGPLAASIFPNCARGQVPRAFPPVNSWPEAGPFPMAGGWAGNVLDCTIMSFGALVPFFIDWMDSEHPAKTAPRGGCLAGIEVFSPQAEYSTISMESLVLKLRSRKRRHREFQLRWKAARAAMFCACLIRCRRAT